MAYTYQITAKKDPQATPPHSGTVSCSSYSGTFEEGVGVDVTVDAVPNAACGWQLALITVRWRYEDGLQWRHFDLTEQHATFHIGDSGNRIYEVTAYFTFAGTGLIMRDGADETKILRGSRDDAKVLLDI